MVWLNFTCGKLCRHTRKACVCVCVTAGAQKAMEVNFRVKPITDYQELAQCPQGIEFPLHSLCHFHITICIINKCYYSKVFCVSCAKNPINTQRESKVWSFFAITNEAQMPKDCNQITWIPLNVILYFHVLWRWAKEWENWLVILIDWCFHS